MSLFTGCAFRRDMQTIGRIAYHGRGGSAIKLVIDIAAAQ
ncbi:hypothetical protein I546_7176 [Mycobacterium kansasii 732]|nr:hypothetical protein I546_7176 [Mycobacterium kansasii 732]